MPSFFYRLGGGSGGVGGGGGNNSSFVPYMFTGENLHSYSIHIKSNDITGTIYNLKSLKFCSIAI